MDVAITGSVALSKAGTPLLYAGEEVPALISLLEQYDAPLTILKDSRPGDAMRVKLLRSVLMKGLEGLAVECLPAARVYGVLDQLEQIGYPSTMTRAAERRFAATSTAAQSSGPEHDTTEASIDWLRSLRPDIQR